MSSRNKVQRWILCLLVVGVAVGLAIPWPAAAPQIVSIDGDAVVNTWDDVIIDLGQKVPLGRRQVTVTPEAVFQPKWSDDGSQLTLAPLARWESETLYTVQLPRKAGLTFMTGQQPTTSVFAGGDVMLDKLPGENIRVKGPESVFAGMGDLISSADIAFVNLEGPVSTRGAPVNKRYTFCGRPEALDALDVAGVDVVSFANNHAADYGLDAFVDTLTHLQEQGIGYTGAGLNKAEALSPWITELKGTRIAFLAFAQRDVLPAWSYGLFGAGVDKPGMVFHDGLGAREEMLAAIKAAKQEADLVFVSMHWCYERETKPRQFFRDLGASIIDAGADAIIGHHPHLPYGVELYQGKPIIYSLGNFLFHPYVPAQRESYVVVFEASPEGVTGLKLHPILMEDGMVELLTGDAADNLAQAVIDRSSALGTRVERQGDVLIVQLP